MTPDEHHKIMTASLDDHLSQMPKGTQAILVSYERVGCNASIVSSMEDVDTARLLKQLIDVKEMGN